MPKQEVTPGYEWFEVPPPETITGGDDIESRPINLQGKYPLLDAELLQDAWDSKELRFIECANGTRITTATFNPQAEGGSMLWLPGWGVSNLRGGGARVVSVLSALNPHKRVIAAEELENVPADHRVTAHKGDMEPYALNYLHVVDENLDTLSGHSRGAIIQAHLAGHSNSGRIRTVNLMDSPRIKGYRSSLGFGLRVGVIDNLVQGKHGHLTDVNEEALVGSIAQEADGTGEGPLEAIGKAFKQRWLIKAMSQLGLEEILEAAIVRQSQADFFIWHGTHNVGSPIEAMRSLVSSIRTKLPVADQARIRYFESSTGHYSEGHTARYGRQTTYAIEQSRR